MTHPIPPKAFISHATEDKDRFVTTFAQTLRQNGVDAWLDKWEMQPGDSLVDKIFEEGIKDASVFIIVISATSVAKPWVKEELNAGFVKRLSGQCRVIPVVLDDCEIPECLHSTVWQPVKDVDHYPEEFKSILNTIFGLSDKPPIGTGPAHAEVSPLLALAPLSKIDNMVLEVLCEESVRANDAHVMNMSCLDRVSDAGATDEDIRDAVKILGDDGYLELVHVMGPTYRNTHVAGVRIETHAFDEFAKAKWPKYDAILTRLVGGLVNEGWHSKPDIDQLDEPERLGDHLIRVLEESGNISVSRHFGGYSVWKISPKLKRALAND